MNFRFFSISSSNFAFFLRIFDEFFSGFRAKFQKIVTCAAFSIKFAKTNQKFAENSEFCEKNSLLLVNYSLHSLTATRCAAPSGSRRQSPSVGARSRGSRRWPSSAVSSCWISFPAFGDRATSPTQAAASSSVSGTSGSRLASSQEEPKLKGSIGEGPNHSNFSDQSSVKIQEIQLKNSKI